MMFQMFISHPRQLLVPPPPLADGKTGTDFDGGTNKEPILKAAQTG